MRQTAKGSEHYQEAASAVRSHSQKDREPYSPLHLVHELKDLCMEAALDVVLYYLLMIREITQSTKDNSALRHSDHTRVWCNGAPANSRTYWSQDPTILSREEK